MTTLTIPVAAFEAAAREAREDARRCIPDMKPWEDMSPGIRQLWIDDARAVVAAAGPSIEAAFRGQVGAVLLVLAADAHKHLDEAREGTRTESFEAGCAMAYDKALRIVRGTDE